MNPLFTEPVQSVSSQYYGQTIERVNENLAHPIAGVVFAGQIVRQKRPLGLVTDEYVATVAKNVHKLLGHAIPGKLR